MRVAALDFGSNTFLCLIADIDEGGNISVLLDEAEVIRLGQGVATEGIICREALVRAEKCLFKFSEEIKQYRPEKVFAVATAAARKASNREELVTLANLANIPMKIISGEKEAEFTFNGVMANGTASNKKKLIIDIGGGSTELILGSSGSIFYKKSFEVGVVKLREKYLHSFPILAETVKLLEQEIRNTFLEVAEIFSERPFEVTAVAGTPTTLAAVVLGGFDPKKIEGFQFSKEELEGWQQVLVKLTPEEIEKKFEVPGGRSDVLAVGVMILNGVLNAVGVDHLCVSVRGLRYGLALALATKENIYAE